MKKSPWILVTGATGFIGSNLAKSLQSQGEEVRCLVRNASPAEAVDYLKQSGVELVHGDLDDSESLRKAVTGMDIV